MEGGSDGKWRQWNAATVVVAAVHKAAVKEKAMEGGVGGQEGDGRWRGRSQ